MNTSSKIFTVNAFTVLDSNNDHLLTRHNKILIHFYANVILPLSIRFSLLIRLGFAAIATLFLLSYGDSSMINNNNTIAKPTNSALNNNITEVNPMVFDNQREWAWMKENGHIEIGTDVSDGVNGDTNTQISANSELFEYVEGAGNGYYYQKIDYSITDTSGKAYIYAGLYFLADLVPSTPQDVSQHTYISIWLKSNTDKALLPVKLAAISSRDESGQQRESDIRLTLTPNWTHYKLPLSDFKQVESKDKAVDWTSLSSLALAITNAVIWYC